MDKFKSYTYVIGWTKFNKWYYGVQFSSTANPTNLWTTYFTSSPIVSKFREKHGEPDVIQIRKTFDNRVSAQNWENKVLKRLNVLNDDKWLNENIAGSISSEYCAKGGRTKKGKPFFGSRTAEEITEFYAKASSKRKGKPSNNKGKPCPESAKIAKSKKLLGKPKPDHMRESLSKTRKGSKKMWREDGSWYWYIPSKSIDS